MRTKIFDKLQIPWQKTADATTKIIGFLESRDWNMSLKELHGALFLPFDMMNCSLCSGKRL